MTSRPHYHFPFSLLAPRIPSLLLGRRRALHADVNAAFAAIGAAPHAVNAEHILQREPFLLVMNHFHRRDIPSWWMVMAVMKAVADQRAGHAPPDLRMIVATQWTYTNPWQKIFVAPVMRFVVGRIMRAYDFLPMEPTALGASHANQRARSIRGVVVAAKQARQAQFPIGLAPEGGDTLDSALRRPPNGAGRFMLLLAATGLPFLPVGVYVSNERLVTNFGTLFALRAPPALSKGETDEWASREVMERIACLLPAELRGAYDG
ncbi:MAG: 1-acyl-sn-glycerol-3-phosphate acyltransferase [Chloroflexota bacterium]